MSEVPVCNGLPLPITYDTVAAKGASELQSVLHNLHRGWSRASSVLAPCTTSVSVRISEQVS